MATARKTTTTTATAEPTAQPADLATVVEQARQAVADAAARHIATAEALRLATEHATELDQRLAHGDDAVSAEDYLRADAEVRRAAALDRHAADAEAQARADQAVRVATATAKATAQHLSEQPADDVPAMVAATLATVRGALADLAARIGARNARLAEAIETATEAGLIAGKGDPMSPVLVRPRSRFAPVALIVNGEAVEPIDAAKVAAELLAEVAA